MPKGIPKDIAERARPPQRQNGGRKKIPIDWKKVESLIMQGCSGIQVAAFLGIDRDTLYIRCKSDQGCDFSVYWYKHHEKGNSNLHMKQYQEAMKGDKTLLVWLGKNRLKQTDKLDSTIDAKVEVSQKALLESPDNGRRKINDSSS